MSKVRERVSWVALALAVFILLGWVVNLLQLDPVWMSRHRSFVLVELFAPPLFSYLFYYLYKRLRRAPHRRRVVQPPFRRS